MLSVLSPAVRFLEKITTFDIQRLQVLQKWFRWTFLVPVWGPVIGMLKLAIDYPNASDIWFLLTYLYIGLATAWTLVFWVSTEWLQKKNPGRWKRPKNRRITQTDWRTFRILQWGGVILVLSSFLGVTAIARWMQVTEWERKQQEEIAKQEDDLKQELERLNGRLYPSNEPMPQHICGDIKESEIIVFLGSNAAVIKSFPHTILKVKGKDRLVVNRRNDGSISLTLDVFSQDGRIIAMIEDGEFVLNPNNMLTKRRKDRHGLEVIDQYRKRVLSMRCIFR